MNILYSLMGVTWPLPKWNENLGGFENILPIDNESPRAISRLFLGCVGYGNTICTYGVETFNKT